MEKIRFGVIGCGNQGGYYARILLEGKVENGILSAICDINPVKTDAMNEYIGDKDVKKFSDYIEMLDSKLCDVVMVEVPHYLHPQMVIDCLKRDINVISDKPAGVYAKQVKEMNEVAKTSKAKFGMMFNQRTNPCYKLMKQMIANGDLGEIQRVNWIVTDWFRTQYYYDHGSWRASWKGEGGGVLINQCPHQIDLLQWVMGEMPVSVNAFCKYGKWHDIEVEDEVTAYFEFKNGATGVFITTTGEAPGSNRLEISGTKGKLLCEGNKLKHFKNDCDTQTLIKEAPTAFTFPNVEIEDLKDEGFGGQHVEIMNNFANSLLGLETMYVDGTEGINNVELMNAIEYSGWKGGVKVNIPMDSNKYYKELKKHVKKSKLRQNDDNTVIKLLNFGTGQEKVK